MCYLVPGSVILCGRSPSKGSASEIGGEQTNQGQEPVLIQNPILPLQLHVESAQQDMRGCVYAGHLKIGLLNPFPKGRFGQIEETEGSLC